MAGRQTRGRQRIPIRRIENQDDMYATFSKRRLGLYKKASELSTLCGADVGIIIFSPTDNPYSFFHPSMESVIERHRNPTQQIPVLDRAVEAHTRARVERLNTRLDEVLAQKEEIKKRDKQLDEMAKNQPKGWWEEPIENLNKEQVKEWLAFFKEFSNRVNSRIEELKNAGVEDPSVNFAQNYVPSMTQYPSGDDPSHYYLPPPNQDDPFTAGGSSSQFFGPYTDIPQQGQNPFGDHGAGPSHYYLPPTPQDPSVSGGTFWSFPDPNPSAGGGGTDEAGPSHQRDNDP